MSRVVQVSFDTPEDFQREHTANLANGGIFVESTEHFSPRERLGVEILLSFCNMKVFIDGEIVHVVPPELARTGARPGIAIQFVGSAAELRRRLDPLVTACGGQPSQLADSGRRVAPRVTARVSARIEGPEKGLAGKTRNISQTGVLITVPGGDISPGQRVRVTLQHPTSGEEMEVEGEVVRQVETGGEVAALGIHFDPPEECEGDVAQFVGRVQSAEHTRRLGGISGPIEDLGCQDLLQMFGTTAPAGTLTLRHGEDEGVIGFENKLLHYARLGSATGMKALVRLLSWESGRFEFVAHLEPVENPEPPLPLDVAIFSAVESIDAGRRIDRSRLPAEAKVKVAPGAGPSQSAQEPLSKIEEAVLDLARVGFTVQRIVDVIPEPDPAVLHALEMLADRGLVDFES